MRVKDKRGISPLHLGMHEFARLAEERIMVQESSLRGESSHSPPTGASFRPPGPFVSIPSPSFLASAHAYPGWGQGGRRIAASPALSNILFPFPIPGLTSPAPSTTQDHLFPRSEKKNRIVGNPPYPLGPYILWYTTAEKECFTLLYYH